ncbi:MAG TPA: acyl CoA:acetate/3-ketoacid CoA transferase [Smithellaceae bacterium]|jgi:propionate CoA-transferase|nr:acyl CoA:acetate/3-ketoacid CoA transferase [Smithellaceae bacterium]HNY96519.1 acyl CoA:acetate/3-ketoacid CoA transferase [Smithellaceae bacterium]HOH57456.1 acyl CoA:acetate/3-ketoacid CoA transferase [Smithellaceae bacterium]HPB15203.1 acyl CoA:acetate/3-ketoacid CoA transferase [Smithellaceae bacterium]HPO21850.1 acyl CoA:acetate/3-ketoacid CoA transferase [Smithellaceae bacterium]
MSNQGVVSPVVADIRSGMKRGKVVSLEDAMRVIRDGDTIAVNGFVGYSPEELLQGLEDRFLKTGEPKNLTIIVAAGIGDGKEKGVNRLAHDGLVRRVIAGHWGLIPKMQKLALAGKIEAYNFPQGVITHMYRDIAGHLPRTITHVGLGTFVDPRLSAGKVNAITTEDLVERITFDGKEYLAYKTMPVSVVFLRGTTADMDGNITMEKEPLTLEMLPMAMAAKNSGGFVIVQVERIADRHALNPRHVKVPGILVDCVVVAKPENHRQTYSTYYNPAYSGEFKVPTATVEPLPMDERKLVARRAAFELRPNMVVNLGIGMPEGVANVANEEGIFDYLTLTAEAGSIGGIPSGGGDFGTATNMDFLNDMHAQFDYYDGGGLDLACLGLAQMDSHGNVNVSKFGPKLAGCGGFINITQNAKKIVFAGTFTAGGTQLAVENGKLKIVQEGSLKKIVREVEQITFSGKTAQQGEQQVFYVTERCVFRLTREGVELIEIAPGIDLEKDLLAQMEFKPIMKNVRPMDERIFKLPPMGLKDDLLSIPIPDRLTYDPATNIFYVNFEGLHVRSSADIEAIRSRVTKVCAPLGKRVKTIVNYDNFSIAPDLEDEYVKMVKFVVSEYYSDVTRYTTSAFLRMKLGDELKKRNLAPHIFQSKEEAREALE